MREPEEAFAMETALRASSESVLVAAAARIR
jgi:hypothetical protein